MANGGKRETAYFWHDVDEKLHVDGPSLQVVNRDCNRRKGQIGAMVAYNRGILPKSKTQLLEMYCYQERVKVDEALAEWKKNHSK